MTALSEKLRQKYFGGRPHPYRLLEQEIEKHVFPYAVIVDAGCGRSAPVLVKFRGKAKRLVGIDLVDFPAAIPGLELINGDLSGNLHLPDASVDLVYSRSVMEHLQEPGRAYAEVGRILKPGGKFIFLTANKLDYASLIAMATPNRWHGWIVRRTEGRNEEDVFPTAYKTNTKKSIESFARKSNLDVVLLTHLGQYPSYFMFNGGLFLLATLYQKTIERVPPLRCLQGWIFAILQKPSSAQPSDLAVAARALPGGGL